MASDGIKGEVTGTLDQKSVELGAWQQQGNSVTGGSELNRTARFSSATVNIGENGKTSTPIAVVVTVAKPEAGAPKKAPEEGVQPEQKVAQPKGVINNTPVDGAQPSTRLGAPTAGTTAAVGSRPARGRITNNKQSTALAARPSGGPVAKAQANAGALTPATPQAGALALKKDGPPADGPKTQPGAKQDPKAAAPFIGVEEKVILVNGIAAHRERENVIKGKLVTDLGDGAELRGQGGPGNDERGPQHGRRPQYGNAMPRNGLEDGQAPKDAPQVALDKPAPKAAPVARIASPTAKMAQLPSNAPTPYAKA